MAAPRTDRRVGRDGRSLTRALHGVVYGRFVLTARRNKYVALVVLTIPLLIVIDLLLEVIGRANEDLRMDPEVWGTYGEWAAAIIPALAIVTTIQLWLHDRVTHEHDRRMDRRKLLADASTPDAREIALNLTRDGNGFRLVNGSEAQVHIRGWAGQAPIGELVDAHRIAYIDRPTEVGGEDYRLQFRLGGREFEIKPEGRAVAIDSE